MGVTVSIDTRGLDNLIASLDDIQLAFANEVRELAGTNDEPSKGYVPMEYGDLRGNVVVDKDEITYTEDYAVYVYNMDDANFTTPGTCGHWIEKVKENHMDELEEFVAGRIEKATK